jgi:precorrin-2 dehydrogenase/sirohydrochlorin ferrochelatase
VNLDLRGRTCLVVGGGEVGERKVRGLLECGARVRLVSRELTSGLSELVGLGQVDHLGAEYRTEHLSGAMLVFAATSDADLNLRLSHEAQSRGLWVNIVDQPELCTFIVPATFSRGDLTISVSTGGRSPALAARVRARLEKEFGPEYDLFLRLMGLVRARVLATGRPASENRAFFRSLVDSPLLDRLAAADRAGAEMILTQTLGEAFTFQSLGFDIDGEAP